MRIGNRLGKPRSMCCVTCAPDRRHLKASEYRFVRVLRCVLSLHPNCCVAWSSTRQFELVPSSTEVRRALIAPSGSRSREIGRGANPASHGKQVRRASTSSHLQMSHNKVSRSDIGALLVPAHRLFSGRDDARQSIGVTDTPTQVGHHDPQQRQSRAVAAIGRLCALGMCACVPRRRSTLRCARSFRPRCRIGANRLVRCRRSHRDADLKGAGP